MRTDTIVALATAPGRAAVAVVRLSGPQTRVMLEGLGAGRLAPRRLSLRQIGPADAPPLDQALAVFMPGPDSYTGEDCAELHLHGGRAVVEAVLDALTRAGARLAEPGEFTRRAFAHGRLDLTQAEAVADLVDAETEGQRRQALAQLDGELGRRYRAWREALADALALLEAEIDFPDEDLPERLSARIRTPLQRLADDLATALETSGRGSQVREGWRLALTGAPNAGKSSLFNALLERDAAIVTPVAGTTRDVIEGDLTLNGYKVTLADTAGLRVTEDVVEVEGVRRARAWAEDAALRCWVVDGSGEDPGLEDAALGQAGDVLVLAKADLPQGRAASLARAIAEARGWELMRLSAASGEGVAALRERLAERVTAELTGADFPAATRERHRHRLEEALAAVRRAEDSLGRGAELAAEDLRLAARALGSVVGEVGSEEVLGRVFASFCIGK